LKWSVAIFSSRETEATLLLSIAAAATAVAGVEAVIDVIINGNPLMADGIGRHIAENGRFLGNRPRIRVWSIGIADKSNALNQYIHEIWPGSEIAFFIDGYVQVLPDALVHIGNGLEKVRDALAGSGVATMGSSAEAHRKSGEPHGNLFAIRGQVLADFRRVGFRLPLGLYRTDATLFAVIRFRLNPADHEWDPRRILVVPQATWIFRPLSWWKPNDIRSHVKRMMRQAQGDLENLAVREHLALLKRRPEDLQGTTLELVRSWIESSPADATRTYLRNPLRLIAARRLLRSRTDWTKAATPPALIFQSGSDKSVGTSA
jgi:hypothetical protein